jgi:hypothetical protein
LGEIREVHAWNTGGGAGDRPIPTDKHDLPDYVHWDLWLGPAQWRQYNSRWYEWLDAVKGGPAAMSNFDYAAPLAEYVLLGNIATLVGEKIEFDPAAMKITNHESANSAIQRQYRAGWTL